uniref:Uncharacterized protein n=1 Tax=Mycena chlorophos TaxID=658473 RepID=A0ABQ0LHU1_MYCCL|nr:predicted protein [Mycena chlorophos]
MIITRSSATVLREYPARRPPQNALSSGDATSVLRLRVLGVVSFFAKRIVDEYQRCCPSVPAAAAATARNRLVLHHDGERNSLRLPFRRARLPDKPRKGHKPRRKHQRLPYDQCLGVGALFESEEVVGLEEAMSVAPAKASASAVARSAVARRSRSRTSPTPFFESTLRPNSLQHIRASSSALDLDYGRLCSRRSALPSHNTSAYRHPAGAARPRDVQRCLVGMGMHLSRMGSIRSGPPRLIGTVGRERASHKRPLVPSRHHPGSPKKPRWQSLCKPPTTCNPPPPALFQLHPTSSRAVRRPRSVLLLVGDISDEYSARWRRSETLLVLFAALSVPRHAFASLDSIENVLLLSPVPSGFCPCSGVGDGTASVGTVMSLAVVGGRNPPVDHTFTDGRQNAPNTSRLGSRPFTSQPRFAVIGHFLPQNTKAEHESGPQIRKPATAVRRPTTVCPRPAPDIVELPRRLFAVSERNPGYIPVDIVDVDRVATDRPRFRHWIHVWSAYARRRRRRRRSRRPICGDSGPGIGDSSGSQRNVSRTYALASSV